MALTGHVWDDPLPNDRGPDDKIPIYNDINLTKRAIFAMQKAGLLTVEDALQGLARVNIPTNFIRSDTRPDTLGPDDVWINTGGPAVQDTGFFADRASSTCGTMPFALINGSLTLTSGGIVAGRAINKATKQYTAIRTHIITQTTAATDMFMGVWGEDGSLLASTANLSASSVVGSLLSASLTTPLNLSAGVPVFLGIATIGGSGITVPRMQFGGGLAGTSATLGVISPARPSWLVTGNAATSAAPPNLSGTTLSANIPWLELV